MATTQHAFGAGPHGQYNSLPRQNGPEPGGGPQNSAHAGPYRSHPEDPHHHHHHLPQPQPQPQPQPRPYFFVQPSQPYYPYQWPVPMPYNPYCGFPGYGMVMPPFPSSPYMEAPGYIVPHAQLHLADYRRMVNPHFPQTMAYHTRRFRYQQSAAPRETANSEAQTEAPPVSRCESRDAPSPAGSAHLVGPDSGRGSSCADASSPPQSHGSRPRAGTPPDHPDPEAMPTAAPTVPAGYVYRKEEVRIECSGSPVGLKIVRSHETSAQSVPGAPSGDLLQCDVWSISSAEGVIPLYRSSVHEGEVTGDDRSCPGAEEQCVPSYPDILLVGGPPTSHRAELPALHSCDAPAERPPSDTVGKVITPGCGQGLRGEADMDRHRHDNDDEGHAADSVKNVHFKILRLPFEMQYLEDLRKLEESVWSVESLVPYVPSAEWMVQHRFVEPEAAAESSVVEVPMETSTSQSEALPALETSREVAVVQNRSQQESLSSLDSLDSLPPYLPSTSWLADFGNVYYYSKLPLNVQEQLTIVGAPADQLAVWRTPGKEQRGQRPATAAAPHRRKEEKRRRCRKTEGRGDLDRDGAPAPPDEARRNCGRCLTKRNVSAGPDLTTAATVKRHRATHPSAASDPPKTLTCSACECGSVKPATRKRPVPGVPGHRVEGEEMEDEAVENRAHSTVTKQQQQQQGGEPGMAVDARKPASSKRHSEMCSVALCSKLREQNCSCENPQRGPAREGRRRGLLADTTKEGNEIAAPSIPAADKWKTAEQKSRQTEKLWRSTVAISDRESSENGARPRNVNKPKKMSTQTQERQQFKMSNKAITPRSQNTDFGEPIEGYYKRSNWTKGTHRRDTRY